VFPTIGENEKGFYAQELGHPLISNEKLILNTVKMTGMKRLLIVTGSNMSGKSTLLRSIGVNMVLAFAGAPVCAKSFVAKNFRLITYMPISDSLHENISTFQAELIRIKQILETTRQYDDVFVLLDELLRGTNTKDRELGCKAIVTQLIHDRVPAIIATHDLNLTNIEHRYPEKVENFHFDIQIKGNNMYFDYKLKEGICNNFNASLMLKEIGLDLDIIENFESVG
jgi:DNA mismatch repair ATPase MutS